MTMDEWIQILQGALTPLIAALAVFIAWQQWTTNRNKLKLDLFERRYAYYEAATEMVGRILTSGRASTELTFEFLTRTKGAKFLLGTSLAEYLDELYRRAVRLQGLGSELESLSGEERSRNIQRQRELKEWFQAQFDVMDKKFAKLLTLSH